MSFALSKTMSKWTRIPDGTPWIKKERKFRFHGPNGPYTITLSPSSLEYLRINFDNAEELWPMNIVEVQGSTFKISGLADWVPEILLDECWYEFVIGSERAITYIGSKGYRRKDVASL